MKKVKDVMTTGTFKNCTLNTKIQSVAMLMKDSNKGALPVVDSNNKVIGMVTDRDICLSLATRKEKKISELTVKDVISNLNIHSVKAEDNVTKALQEMRKNKIGRLPVVDKEGKLKGMLSVNNLLSNIITNDEEIGSITSKEENLAKTVKALVERDYKKQTKKEIKESEIEQLELVEF